MPAGPRNSRQHSLTSYHQAVISTDDPAQNTPLHIGTPANESSDTFSAIPWQGWAAGISASGGKGAFPASDRCGHSGNKNAVPGFTSDSQKNRLREPRSPRLDHRRCWMTHRMAQLRPSWQRPGRPGSATAGAWWTLPWCWRCGTAVCAARRPRPLVWSDIERWDDGSGRLLIERSRSVQTGEGKVVFITVRAITAPEELWHLRGDASQFVAPDSAIMRQGPWSGSTMVAR